MPEYLAPGVYVEETSFRSKSIEGVSTSTAGFVGPARFGPVTGDPELLTSFADFERIYGGLEDLVLSDGTLMENYLAHAVRAFFDEGGQQLYVSRVINFGTNGYQAPSTPENDGIAVPTNSGYASYPTDDKGNPLTDAQPWRLIARFPGSAGNIRLTFTLQAATNILTTPGGNVALTRVQSYDLAYIRTSSTAGAWQAATANSKDGLYTLFLDATKNTWFVQGDDATKNLDLAAFVTSLKESNKDLVVQIRPVTVVVEAEIPSGQGFSAPSTLGNFAFDPRSTNGLTTTFIRQPITRFAFLTTPFSLELSKDLQSNVSGAAVARTFFDDNAISTLRDDVSRAPVSKVCTLAGGNDGALPIALTYEGDPDETRAHDFIDDPLQRWKNGLLALEGIEDISIVAAPGYSDLADADVVFAVHNALINHCEKMRYRIAVLDTPRNLLISETLAFRNLRSSSYGALYYPWVTISDPNGAGRLNLPPSGFIAGIYARNDNNRSVSKAPANEVIGTAIDFEQRLNKAQQEVLNPAGVNCLRFFPGHGFLVWGARTISDDPEWKYVNLRRYFAYLEHSIDRGTQWVVFENNNRQLWDNVRHTIEDFLLNEWKMGSLAGSKPEEAYFVRCDLSTMTQNDLDNGRLVCLIGVAPVRPAEFVIFRIGQWTSNTGSR